MEPGAQTRLDDDPFVGRTFDGYRVEAVIGRGGMGVVYRAVQLSLNRAVAIKVLPEAIAEQPQFLERFHREVDVLSRLAHPNIVTVMERGEVDGRPYLVMEHVEGESVRDVVKRGPLPRAQALTIARSVLAALEHAHDKGIIHRDIKPENVLLAKGDIVKVADFGLGRLLSLEDTTRLTHTALLLGTFEYMAPEQREKAKEADERSDLYAAGVVFYEMLTGELPIGRFDLPSQRRPAEFDRRIDAIVEKSLEKAPERRYQRASEMGAAVSELLTAAPVEPAPIPPPPPAPVPPAPVAAQPAPWSQDWRFAIALTALWVFIVLAANEFKMRDEEWMWLIVGAFASVWIIPRLRRLFDNLVLVAAVLLVGLLFLGTFYLSVGTDAAVGDIALAPSRAQQPGWVTRIGYLKAGKPASALAAAHSEDARRWVSHALETELPVYPADIALERKAVGASDVVSLRLGTTTYPDVDAVAAAVAAFLERVLDGDFRRTAMGTAGLEERLKTLPPPGGASESVRVARYERAAGQGYPTGLEAIVRSHPLRAWVAKHVGGGPDLADGVALEYDRGEVWARIDMARFPSDRVRGRIAAAVAASLVQVRPDAAERVFQADAEFERVLKESPPPGLPIVRIDEEGER